MLRLMEGSEREAFERAMVEDAELATVVDVLARNLAALDATAESGQLRDGLFDDVSRRIDGIEQLERPADNVVPFACRAAPVPGLIGRRAMLGGIAACLVVTLGAGFLAGSQLGRGADPVVIAVLLQSDGVTPAAIVEAFGDNSVHLVPLVDFDVPAGRVLQVWTLPDVETGPVSLGTLDRAREMQFPGPVLPGPREGQL